MSQLHLSKCLLVQDVSPFSSTFLCDLLKRMHSRKLLTLLPLLAILASCSRDPKVQAQQYVDQGNKFFAKTKYKEASIMYRRALQKDLRFGEAYYRLALTDLKLGAVGDASRMLRRSVELQPSNVDAMTKLADLYILASIQDKAHQDQLLKDAADLCDKLLKIDPKSYDGHRLLGQMALVKRDAPGAVTEFEQANTAKPDQPDLVMAYFQALVASNRFPEAEKLAQHLIDKEKTYSPMYDLLYVQYMRQNKPEQGENILKLKIANNPQRANYQMQLAQHYFTLNRKDDMEAVIQKVTDEKAYPEGHLLAGDFFFFRTRDFQRSEEQYQAAIKAFPKDKATYEKRLVELYASTGRNTDANRVLATLLKDNPKDNDAIAMRAALMLTTGNREQINMATNDLQSLVTKTPNNHLLRFELARALVAKGDVEAARLQLEEAIKLRSDFIAAREMLARIYMAKNEPQKALQAADDILNLDRNNMQAHLTRSAALLTIGDKDKAHQELEFIARAYPQNVEARFQTGFLAWQEKDFKKAEQVFGDLYKSNPNDARGLAGLTEALAGEGRMGDAIKDAEKASDAAPNRRDLRMFVAKLYVRSERYDQAITIYKGLLDKDPKSANLLFQLAETERRKGDLNASMEAFRRCSQEAPNDTVCLQQLGMLLEGTGKGDQAKPIWEQILKIQPDAPVALNNLAYQKAEEGVDLDQALTMAQRAVQKVPNSMDMADTLGWIYIKKNLSDDAVRVFHDLVQKDPKNPTFHYHYGMALLQKGDKPSAKKELEKAMQENPSKDQSQKIQDLLRKI
jgi:tetratricopeptide (TPR) repeat protein